MEVFPGIHRIKLPIPSLPSGERPTGVLSSVNVYLIQGKEGWTLVDTGLDIPETFTAFERGIEAIGIGFPEISNLVVTHAHVDHIAFSQVLKKASGAKFYLHQLEAAYTPGNGPSANSILATIERWLKKNGCPRADSLAPPNLPEGPVNYLSPAFPDAFNYRGTIPVSDVFISNGDTIDTGIFRFDVLWTPGHSAGHVCLYAAEQKILISGDHVLPHITPAIILNPYSQPNPLADFMKSLRRVGNLDVNLVLPGHGDLIFDLKKRVHELLHHHNSRLIQILAILRNTPKTAHAIATEISWMPQQGGVSWQCLDLWSRRLALMETLAHLKVLETESRIERIVTTDADCYDLK